MFRLQYPPLIYRCGKKPRKASVCVNGQASVKKEGYKSVAVIGTSYSLNQALYAKPLSRLGIEMVVLDAGLVNESHRLIGTALAGIPKKLTSQYVDFVRKIAKKTPFDALILGCTEYSVLEDRRKQELSGSIPVAIIDPLMELAAEIDKIYYGK